MSHNLNEINSTILKIEDTSSDQERHIDIVKNELSRIVQIANQNTSTSEKNASSSEELASQAEILKQILSKFMI